MRSRLLFGFSLLSLASAAALALALGSCAVVGFEVLDTTAQGGATSSSSNTTTTSAGGGGSSSTSSGCEHAAWPNAPAASDPGPDNVDVVFAIRKIDFGEGDLTNGPLVGFDLDNRCTCQGEGDSCKEPSWATGDHCDGPQGRDNAAAQLFAVGSLFSSLLSSKTFTDDAEAGQGSLLVRVMEYNGKPNDTQVSVALYPSPGLDKDPCIDPIPKWDGNDRWPVASTSVKAIDGGGGAGACGALGYDLDSPLYVDHNAYVTDGTMVGNLTDAAIIFASSSKTTTLKITAGFLTGKLVQANSQWKLEQGLLAGRWKLSDVFQFLSTIESQGMPLCTDSPVYDLVKNAFCQFPDIVSNLGGPTTPCDAVSVALAIEGEAALLGEVFEGKATPSPCTPETDPTNDSCGS